MTTGTGSPDRAGHDDDGPVIPDRSADDEDVGWGEEEQASDDERLRRERPPHW